MSDIFARNLIGMTVVGTQGALVGEVADITTNTRTGTILNLLIKSDYETEQEAVDIIPDEDGLFRLPIERVRAVRDTIVVKL